MSSSICCPSVAGGESGHGERKRLLKILLAHRYLVHALACCGLAQTLARLIQALSADRRRGSLQGVGQRVDRRRVALCCGFAKRSDPLARAANEQVDKLRADLQIDGREAGFVEYDRNISTSRPAVVRHRGPKRNSRRLNSCATAQASPDGTVVSGSAIGAGRWKAERHFDERRCRERLGSCWWRHGFHYGDHV
jgi:hypothetical protein